MPADTTPLILETPDARPATLAVAVAVTCGDTPSGVQVPLKLPDTVSTAVKTSDGSLSENVTVTCAFGTGLPQSSSARMLMAEGTPCNTAKLFTRPVCTGTTCLGAQLALGARLAEVTADGPA